MLKCVKEKFIKIKVLRNFIDKEPTLENNSNSNYILYFGRLERIKGVHTLIEAITGMNSNILLKIVGDGHDKEELEAFVKSSRSTNIEFCGYKSGNELEYIIRNSLFIIVPSEWYENCPYTIIEGMSFGKPVIGSDLGGIKELVKDKWNGLLFKHGDEKDLSKKIDYSMIYVRSKMHHSLDTKGQGVPAASLGIIMVARWNGIPLGPFVSGDQIPRCRR